jgi:hypothetical protein
MVGQFWLLPVSLRFFGASLIVLLPFGFSLGSAPLAFLGLFTFSVTSLGSPLKLRRLEELLTGPLVVLVLLRYRSAEVVPMFTALAFASALVRAIPM